jgi:gluconolactonase
MQNSSVTIFQAAAAQVINTNFEIEKWFDGCSFSEGPVWNDKGFYLFSDIPRNVIYKMEGAGQPEVYIDKSGLTVPTDRDLAEQVGSNGLAYNAAKELVICQHGNGAIACHNSKGMTFLASNYNGKPFNSPNDLVVHPDGTVFFSDPPYGLKDTQLQPDVAQPLAGVYAWRNNKVHLIYDGYQYPNGVCLSPDGSTLYTCSTKPFEASVKAFDTATFELKGELCRENSDGIKCDTKGNLYLCTKEGVLVLNAQGERLALIALETVPANCCWGGKGGKDLFVTARQNIFVIRNLQA